MAGRRLGLDLADRDTVAGKRLRHGLAAVERIAIGVELVAPARPARGIGGDMDRPLLLPELSGDPVDRRAVGLGEIGGRRREVDRRGDAGPGGFRLGRGRGRLRRIGGGGGAGIGAIDGGGGGGCGAALAITVGGSAEGDEAGAGATVGCGGGGGG